MVAQALASASARVGLVGRSVDRLRRTRASLGDTESYIYQADLRSEEAMVDLVQQVKDNQGTVDYLIHIAARGTTARPRTSRPPSSTPRATSSTR